MAIDILVVEDDKNICDMVKRFLQNEGYAVDTCTNGDAALDMFFSKKYHLVILDIMLPGTDGHTLLREFRSDGDTPILMMSALCDDDNQIRAFEREADDYVTKPFSMRILMKRVESLLRRSGMLRHGIHAGGLTLYPESYAVEYDGKKIPIAPKEFDILMLLVRNKNKIISHETMLVKIWGYDFDGNEGIVHANIGKLRAKLPVNIIKTVKGIGYCLEEKTDEA